MQPENFLIFSKNVFFSAKFRLEIFIFCFTFRMWNGSRLLYRPEFNAVLLDLAPDSLREFFQEYVIKIPELPENTDFRPIFEAIESYVISFMTRDHRNILKKWMFLELNHFLLEFAENLKEDPSFVFKTIKRILSQQHTRRVPRN